MILLFKKNTLGQEREPDMVLPFTLFLFLLLVSLDPGNSLPNEQMTRKERMRKPKEAINTHEEKQDRKERSLKSESAELTIFDFSTDTNNNPDMNGEYTKATLDAGPLPDYFTICLAFMVEAWTTEFTEQICSIFLMMMGTIGGT